MCGTGCNSWISVSRAPLVILYQVRSYRQTTMLFLLIFFSSESQKTLNSYSKLLFLLSALITLILKLGFQ